MLGEEYWVLPFLIKFSIPIIDEIIDEILGKLGRLKCTYGYPSNVDTSHIVDMTSDTAFNWPKENSHLFVELEVLAFVCLNSMITWHTQSWFPG